MSSPARVVTVAAPSRLHFGMFSFGDAARRQFGGVGAMIDRPGLRLRVAPADQLEATGPLADRAVRVARRWAQHHHQATVARRIEILAAPPQHVGLGVGTQLALAVGAALQASFGLPPLSPVELALCVGRGERSAVGAYGFFQGGLVIEEGKAPGEAVAPLKERLALPSEWRFVLLRPRNEVGLFGDDERRAFRELPPVPEAVTRRLREIVEFRLAPAARTGDFAAFGESLYEFGHRAGMCFAPRQGGAFATPQLAAWVREIRALGVTGVGQSSWGPTLFALCPHLPAAKSLLTEFLARHADTTPAWTIAAPDNAGAKIEVQAGPQ